MKYDKLKEITPEAYQCVVNVCPAIYEAHSTITDVEGGKIAESRKFYVIIGELITPEKLKQSGLENLAEKIGPNEAMIQIPRELIDNIGK